MSGLTSMEQERDAHLAVLAELKEQAVAEWEELVPSPPRMTCDAKERPRCPGGCGQYVRDPDDHNPRPACDDHRRDPVLDAPAGPPPSDAEVQALLAMLPLEAVERLARLAIRANLPDTHEETP